MLVFPQLSTGGAALYPVVRRSGKRSVVNALADGRTVIYGDAEGGVREWELRAKGLTGDEWAAIEALFGAVRGRLSTFTFLDPAGNLLAHSEDFSDPVWTNGAALQMTPGQTDPVGTTRATRVVNSSGTGQGIVQILAVPGNYQYSMSVWARTDAGSSVNLTASAGTANASLTVALDSQWRRVSLFSALGQSAASVSFGVQLGAGASVHLFGMQAEAQLAPSDYKKTGSGSGAIRARFSTDELRVRAQGTDVFDSDITIVEAGGV